MSSLGAVVPALASAVCYAVSAVLQHREASRQSCGGVALMSALVRRAPWWLAVAATIAGALLHLAALRAGPLLLVQPLGVAALVFALPLGARWAGRRVGRPEYLGAACVVLGLPGVLLAVPHHHGSATASFSALLPAAGAVAVIGVAAMLSCRWLGPRGTPIARAVGAAVCFGFTSGCARAMWLGLGPLVLVAAIGLLSAACGVALAQHAYRDGGLGAPLATLTLVDPLAASLIGILVLGEPVSTSPLRLTVAATCALVTAVGVVLLSRPPAPVGDLPDEHPVGGPQGVRPLA